jgi:peptidoglycan-N-acetylglucosamine deacetylase
MQVTAAEPTGRTAGAPTGPRHGLSFDIEDYYQIVWKDYFGQKRSPTPEVERNTEYLLEVLGQAGVRATFFFLGNVARAYPALVRRAVEAGHELGVHGDEHRYITELDPESFRADLSTAIDAIEQAGGAKVIGHRAAAFSLSRDRMWAVDVMASLGLRYDSSIFPFAGKRYGFADAPLSVYRLENGLYEIPLTVIEAAGRRLPAVGGGYFRLFPYLYTRWALRQLDGEHRPAVTYFHPHEFELGRARVPREGWGLNPKGALRLAKTNLLQSMGRGRAQRAKLVRLVREHRFVPLGDLLPAQA